MRVNTLRLRTDYLDFWVDVSVVHHAGNWLVVAMLGGDPEIGVGRSMEEAVMGALRTLAAGAAGHLLNSTVATDAWDSRERRALIQSPEAG